MSSFIQNFRGRKTKLLLGEGGLDYEYADAEDEFAFHVNYTDIDVDNVVRVTQKNPILKFGSFPFILLAIFAVGKASLVADSFDKLLAAMLVALFWLLYSD